MQHMESLRMQINDAEDQATKVSVEEQTQITIIQALEKDLNSAQLMTKQITDDADLMLKRINDTRSQIFDKQKMISSLESDYASLAETLELVQQERISLSAKLLEKRMYYSELIDEMNSELLQKQIINATDAGTREAEEKSSGEGDANYLEAVSKQKLVRELNTVQTKLEKIRNAKHGLVSENDKIQQSIEQVNCQVNDIKLESKDMDIKSLEDEHKALSSDRNGEKGFMQTLQVQIERLKGISHVTRCACGQEYKVEGKPCA